MSTEYLLYPVVQYDALRTSLPEGVTVRWEIKPGLEPTTTDAADLPRRLYVEGREHVLLVDPCGNSLWMWKVREEDRECLYSYSVTVRAGAAAFEQFGMQGSLLHFARAFETVGSTIHETLTTTTWDSRDRRCRQCGETFVSTEETYVDHDDEPAAESPPKDP